MNFNEDELVKLLSKQIADSIDESILNSLGYKTRKQRKKIFIENLENYKKSKNKNE